MTLHTRLLGVAGIAVGNVLPLALVWTGQLAIGDLVLVYFLELVLAYVLVVASNPFRSVTSRGRLERVKLTAALLGAGLILAPVMASYTFRYVTWDATTAWTVILTLTSSLVGFVATVWRRGGNWRTGLGGAFGWRLVLTVVALVAASAGSSYERLLAAGWEPHSFGNGWALPAGELLTRLALAADLSPVIVAAGILCTYRLVSEVLYEVFDILRDASPTSGRPASQELTSARAGEWRS